MDLIKCQSFTDLQFQFTGKKLAMGKRCSTVTLRIQYNFIYLNLLFSIYWKFYLIPDRLSEFIFLNVNSYYVNEEQ